MKVYLVGGAVRDELLGYEVVERDWVVVGATQDFMLEHGYQRVGKDFPVFLHPDTKEEYALARYDKKTGPGYTGFVCDFSPSVTLEDDLKRRDLTINSIAKDPDNGHLIDPYGGQDDCRNQVLRHVSDAFREDPLRLLRLARFAARFDGFSISPETWQMAIEMVKAGELANLTPERVLAELKKALNEKSSGRFFNVLDDLGANEYLWPWFDHENILSILVTATQQELSVSQKIILISYQNIDLFSKHYPITSEQLALARLLNRYSSQWHNLYDWSARLWVTFFQTIDAFRRPNRLESIVIVLKVIEITTPGFMTVKQIYDVTIDITRDEIDPRSELVGKAYGDALLECRVRRVDQYLSRLQENK